MIGTGVLPRARLTGAGLTRRARFTTGTAVAGAASATNALTCGTSRARATVFEGGTVTVAPLDASSSRARLPWLPEDAPPQVTVAEVNPESMLAYSDPDVGVAMVRKPRSVHEAGAPGLLTETWLVMPTTGLPVKQADPNVTVGVFGETWAFSAAICRIAAEPVFVMPDTAAVNRTTPVEASAVQVKVTVIAAGLDGTNWLETNA